MDLCEKLQKLVSELEGKIVVRLRSGKTRFLECEFALREHVGRGML